MISNERGRCHRFNPLHRAHMVPPKVQVAFFVLGEKIQDSVQL